MSLPVQATWVEVLPDENGSVDPAGLAIHTKGRVVQDARGYLPKSTRARTAALRSFRAEDRQAAEDFDQVANMRADACATRVRRVRRWENHRFAGALVIPTVRPVKPVLLALSDASLDGPLEAWLMVYAAQRMELWPKVELYLTVMGHTAEVARAAAAKLLGVGRSYKDGARSSGVREATYRKQVSTVEAILWDWRTGQLCPAGGARREHRMGCRRGKDLECDGAWVTSKPSPFPGFFIPSEFARERFTPAKRHK